MLCADHPEINQEILVVEVDKFNFSTNEWEKVRSRNGRAIFLGSEYPVSCPIPPDTDLQEEAGSYIYFTKPKDETLYSYRIEGESMAAYPNLPKPWHLLPTWIWIMAFDDRVDIIHQQDIGAAQKFEEEQLGGNKIEGSNRSEEAIERNLCDMPSDIRFVDSNLKAKYSVSVPSIQSAIPRTIGY